MISELLGNYYPVAFGIPATVPKFERYIVGLGFTVEIVRQGLMGAT